MVAPSSTAIIQTKKSIQWVDNVVVHYVDHILDMPPDVYRKVYYTRKEYAAFKNECAQQAATILATADSRSDQTIIIHDDDALLCTRGIEKFISKKFAMRRRDRVEGARQAVLNEQRDQKEEGIESPEFLAELYEDISAPCHQEAHKRALKDHEDIASYMTTQLPSSDVTRRSGKLLGANLLSGFRVVKSKGMQIFTSPMA